MPLKTGFIGEELMEVKAFKAFRFDKEAVGDIGNCIAPPYDVISPDHQDKLYHKSEYNIVQITKGKTTPSDNDSDNQYTRAADCLNAWIEKGVLKQDSRESIYPYIQDFDINGTKFCRFSFIALAKLEEFGKTVRPHEETLEKPKIDRLKLTTATAAGFGLVLMLYQDPMGVADKIIKQAAEQEPLIDFVDEQNVRHRLFAITSKGDVDAITDMMNDKICIIADGHHRYETGLAYLKQTSSPAAGYQMMAFANTSHEGLVVLATHRLVGNLEGFSVEKSLSGLEENFELIRFDFNSPQSKLQAKQQMLTQMKVHSDEDESAFGIYCSDDAFYVAALKDKGLMNSVELEKSPLWRSLDVSILHKWILEAILGINEEKLAKGDNLEYAKDIPTAIDDSIAKVDNGQKQAAFFVNPVKLQQLKAVTDVGEKMPQKSTYFYPKIYTGLTINKL